MIAVLFLDSIDNLVEVLQIYLSYLIPLLQIYCFADIAKNYAVLSTWYAAEKVKKWVIVSSIVHILTAGGGYLYWAVGYRVSQAISVLDIWYDVGSALWILYFVMVQMILILHLFYVVYRFQVSKRLDTWSDSTVDAAIIKNRFKYFLYGIIIYIVHVVCNLALYFYGFYGTTWANFMDLVALISITKISTSLNVSALCLVFYTLRQLTFQQTKAFVEESLSKTVPIAKNSVSIELATAQTIRQSSSRS
jgi:hypothetical protein